MFGLYSSTSEATEKVKIHQRSAAVCAMKLLTLNTEYKMAPCLKQVAKWMVFALNIALLWRHNPTLSFHKYSGGGGGGGGSAKKSEADNSQDYFCTTEMTKRELLPEFDWCRDVTNDAYTRSTKLYALRCAGDVSLLYPALLAELCASISSFLSYTLSLSSAASRQLLVLKSA